MFERDPTGEVLASPFEAQEMPEAGLSDLDERKRLEGLVQYNPLYGFQEMRYVCGSTRESG